MQHRLSPEVEKVLSLAQREARQLGHEYVGTEHVLLAMLVLRPAPMASLGASAEVVRAEIEKLVMRGPAPAAESVKLPLTPRAKRVIDHAHVEATSHSQKLIEPEHLLVGLIKEPDGVAGRVMRGLGLNLGEVRREGLKLQLAQMRIVERAVRPVRASSKCKRKMREELLAHFSTIFDEELSRQSDPQAALKAAAERFGDPVELSRDLQRALPAAQRYDYHVERWFGWRAPESVVSMMLRASFLTFTLVIAVFCVPMAVGLFVQGWKPEDNVARRTFVATALAMALMLPVAHFQIGVCYYRIRDSLWGVFGSKKSASAATLHATLLALSVFASSVGLIAIMNDGLAVVRDMAPQLIATSVFAGVVCTLLAYLRGPIEIRDTIWSCLDLAGAE